MARRERLNLHPGQGRASGVSCSVLLDGGLVRKSTAVRARLALLVAGSEINWLDMRLSVLVAGSKISCRPSAAIYPRGRVGYTLPFE
jgi:hypothetical protein